MTENKTKIGTLFGAASIVFASVSGVNAADDAVASDKALYEENCGVCHQLDGSGVPFMQPELYASPRANGDKGGVIQMILKGSKAVEPGTSEFENEMPGFDYLTDEQIALIATYVRTNFENTGGEVTSEDVARERKRN
jgi:mono/diheme cytochrome c family protein